MQKKIITFCRDTRGSHWWLVARIISVLAPVFIIPYTILIWIDFFPIQKLFLGVLFSAQNISVWFTLIIDGFLIYLGIFSETFLHIWKRRIFLADPAAEISGWSIQIMKFNSIKEESFFKLPFGMKGYWLQPIGNSRRYEPTQYPTFK